MKQNEENIHSASEQENTAACGGTAQEPFADPSEQNSGGDPQENREAADEEAAQAQPAEGQDTADGQLAELQQKYDVLRNDYLRLMADFENYRKNMLKEKQNLLKYGGEETIKKLLPVVDDFERAIASLDNAADMEAVKEGVHLIYAKFVKFLEQSGVEVIPSAQGDTFDDNLHDAMTMFPAPTPELKGKIVDCVTKGYKLNDKVIRFAKVVVGQ